MKRPLPKNSGYTLLFAVLVSVLVLGVAIFITSTARKQFILSSSARDSMYSFYAADSGIECAALADKNTALATTSAASITCAGHTYTPSYVTGSPVDPALGFIGTVYTISDLNIGFPLNTNLPIQYSCAKLSIFNGYNASGIHQIVIESRGYNIANVTGFNSGGIIGNCPQISQRTVERALRLIYYK